MPITGRAGTAPRSTGRNYTAGTVRCIGGLVGIAGLPPKRRDVGDPIAEPLSKRFDLGDDFLDLGFALGSLRGSCRGVPRHPL
jgi:hypothetical protein